MGEQLPIFILGGGGHSRVLIETLKLLGVPPAGIIDPKLEKGSCVNGIEVIGSDEELSRRFPPKSVCLVNGIGTVRVSDARKNIYKHYKRLRYDFVSVVHPSSIVAADVIMDEGVQLMAGTIIQTGTKIGANTIINTRASIDHDCEIGAHVHIAPGAILCGGVSVGRGSHLGTGAMVIQNCCLKANTFVRAGTVVTDKMPSHKKRQGIHYE